jgi:hypothetical protein
VERFHENLDQWPDLSGYHDLGDVTGPDRAAQWLDNRIDRGRYREIVAETAEPCT